MPWGAILGAVIGGGMQAQAADDASEAQRIAGEKALLEQQRQFNLIRGDQQPYRQVGVSSLGNLAQLMGLSGAGASRTGLQMDEAEERARLRSMLEPSFTKTVTDLEADPNFVMWTGEGEGRRAIMRDPNSFGAEGLNPGYSYKSPSAGLDQAGMQAEIDRRIGDLRQSGRLFSGGGQGFDPNTGSFTTPTGEVRSNMPVSTLGGRLPPAGQQGQQQDAVLGRTFSLADLQNDPVFQTSFQFGLDEGRKGIERRAGATGSNDSGATLKALTRFGTDYAGQKAGEAYNRFNTNQTNLFNRYATLAGIGQTANNQVGTAGMNMANQNAGILQGMGNAQAGAMIGQGNAWSGAAQGAGNWWSGNQQLNRLMENRGQGGGYYNNRAADPNYYPGDYM